MQPTHSPSPWSTPPAAHGRWRVLFALGASVATSVVVLQVGASLVDRRQDLVARPQAPERPRVAALPPDTALAEGPQSMTAPAPTAPPAGR